MAPHQQCEITPARVSAIFHKFTAVLRAQPVSFSLDHFRQLDCVFSLGESFKFASPSCRHRAFVVAEFVVFGDMLRSNTRRGRAPADNSDVLAMFRLVYSGEGATQPLVDDSS